MPSLTSVDFLGSMTFLNCTRLEMEMVDNRIVRREANSRDYSDSPLSGATHQGTSREGEGAQSSLGSLPTVHPD